MTTSLCKGCHQGCREKRKGDPAFKFKYSDLETLAEQICDGEGVEKSELCSGIRKKAVVKSRKLFCQLAIKKMGYSGADIARFLGITTSAVNRLAVSEELPEIKR